MHINLFPTKPLAPQAARWLRLSLRLLGLLAWLLLALLCLTTTGCRAREAAPTPTATVVPFPTFTATPILAPTVTPVAVSPLPTALATGDDLPLWIAYNAEGSLWLWQAGASRKLTTVDVDSPLAIAPDREWIAFRREGGLWVITPDGWEQQLISAAAIADLPTKQPDLARHLHHFAWLPHSHRLLWTTSLHTPAVVDAASVIGPNYFLGLNHDLYSVDVDTNQVAQLAAPDDGGIFYPSPDGAWIATVAPDRINLLRTDGSGERRLLDLPAILTYSESPFYAKPLWAADSHSLVVAIPPKDALALAPEPTTIWQLWTDGRAPTQLAHFVTGSLTVSLAPDLTRIGYASRLAATNEQVPLTFHLANIDGAANRIFHTDTGGGFGEWLPDSAHFVYVAKNGATTYLGHIDGRPAISLGSQAMQSRIWLDAKHFLFVPYRSTPDVIAGLWLGVINESGAVENRLLAEGAATFDFVRWSPSAPASAPATVQGDAVPREASTPATGTPLSSTLVSNPPVLTPTITLPAPLYYLGEDQQIWRREPTGALTRLTQEMVGITAYDLSLVHGRLVFVTNDYRDLVEFDPATNERVVKIADVDRTPPANGIDEHTQLRNPRYSPDGTQISFAYHGINLIPSGLAPGAQPTVLQPDNYALDADGRMTNVGPLRIYRAALWSPTSAYLLFYAGMWEGAGYEAYNRQTGLRTPIHRPDENFYISATTVDAWAWGHDGQSGYLASADMRAAGPGLFHVDIAQGLTTQLHTTLPGPQHTQFPIGLILRGVYATSSGVLTLFLNMKDLLNLYQLYQLSPNATPVRLNDTVVTIAGEVLWASDGSGAVVVTDRSAGNGEERPLGALQWISATNHTTAKLKIRGHDLRWGK